MLVQVENLFHFDLKSFAIDVKWFLPTRISTIETAYMWGEILTSLKPGFPTDFSGEKISPIKYMMCRNRGKRISYRQEIFSIPQVYLLNILVNSKQHLFPQVFWFGCFGCFSTFVHVWFCFCFFNCPNLKSKYHSE